MEIKYCQVGPLGANCYGITTEKSCVVIDPGGNADVIMQMLDGRTPDLIILTHRHGDHTGGLNDLVKLTGAPCAAHELDAEVIITGEGVNDGSPNSPVEKIDVILNDGHIIELDDLVLEVIHTPGHTIGSISLYNPEEKVLFSGDTLFTGAHGRTDFPTGDYEAMKKSLARLMELPDETRVLPGHDSFSTIAFNRRWVERL